MSRDKLLQGTPMICLFSQGVPMTCISSQHILYQSPAGKLLPVGNLLTGGENMLQEKINQKRKFFFESFKK
jgi:hypothetical protein